MSDAEHQLKMESQLSQLTGKQDRLIDAIQSLKEIAEKAFAPEYTLDELTIPSNIYKDFASYGYLYNYIFVGDSDAGTTLTIGNRIQTHTITLNGGWNQIHLFDNGWWKASNVINVMLLRSKKDMSTYIGGGGSSSSPLYASLTGSSATLPVVTQGTNVVTIGSGTIAVSSGVAFVPSNIIPQPTYVPANLAVFFKNESGQTVTVIGTNTQTNLIPGTSSVLIPMANFSLVGSGASGASESAWLSGTSDASIFSGGEGAVLYFNFGAATTIASNLEWVLVGY